MKVYIGPYVGHINAYSVLAPLRKFFGDERVSDWADSLSRIWVGRFFNWLNSLRKRKQKVKIDYYDIWSLDHTLSIIIHPALVLLKEKKHGVPFVNNSDVPKELRDTTVYEDPNDEKKFAAMERKWDWVLDEMIWAFGETADPDKDDKLFYWTDENGFYCWDEKAIEEKEKRMDRAFRLFGKYYKHLWD